MKRNHTMPESRSLNPFHYASLPGYQEEEYQLIWALPEAVKEKVRKARMAFQEKYPHPYGVSMQVVLPLVKFRQRQLLEERVKQSVFQLASGWRPFQVTLKDFIPMPSHSIYIPAASRAGSSSAEGFYKISKELKSIQHVLRPDKEHAPFFYPELKLVLATKLPSGLFDLAWNDYMHRTFTAQFLAEACLLIKRSAGTGNWKIVQRFELRDLPVGVKQQSLFDA